ncbi:hypothetical protein [Clavibacter michiganensis]|nr:hypothetical protein [Clavibacter michiganensis]MDO4039275.1 hypothetical protein [Clavibacter michiganensis]MDO4063912.1 hypothetical protein [Clavibacter michiganensis]MDO4110229.1 hypothetical protein [Clavibacter michiganensis]MDO4113407.1 hypothetical protein [Clavibacter michiganensis]MDO4116743.1 hypothetical protein [Clavibacter michiganensis]
MTVMHDSTRTKSKWVKALFWPLRFTMGIIRSFVARDLAENLDLTDLL